MGQMQGGVVSMAGSMGALSSATSGVLGPMGGLVGTMGVIGLAVTGVGLGLSIGINRFKAWREEQKKVSQSSENLRNRLMLSGFSADAATSSVDELRSSLGRLAFQALPGVDFEMQGFIANMDTATKIRFGELVGSLEALGIKGTAGINAIAEAMQGNFGPISKLTGQQITNMEEFAAVMSTTADKAAFASGDIGKALSAIASGEGTLEERTTALVAVIRSNLPEASRFFEEHGAAVARVLSAMTGEEKQYVIDALTNAIERKGMSAAQTADLLTAQAADKAILLLRSIDERTHTDDLAVEIEARIKEIEKVAPATAAELAKALNLYKLDKMGLRILRSVTETEYNRIQGIQAGWIDSLQSDTERAVGLLAQIEEALRRARSAASGIESAASRAESAAARLRAVGGRVNRVVVPRPAPQQVSFADRQQAGRRAAFQAETLRRAGDQSGVIVTPPTVIVKIGDREVRDVVVTVLNDEVSLREPSLGLG